ncbi:TIGR02594 family protein [Aestuariivirga sp.]|uniref:C40 family peptidase n=1 Tax=Aestuariivirga sp. TaxID=2650926 RepID=UPI0035AFA141
MTKTLELARSYLGTKEVTGPADNPKIMEMYRTVGQDWVEHDEMAWCAAFVGHCLETSGIASTQKLNARSYLTWGEKVPSLEQAKEGDVVVLSRGTSGWQGHVAFFLRAVGQQVEVLGGNQGNGVSITRYPKSKILGIRRALGIATSPRPELRVVQQQLKDLGYHEVGNIDGSYGPRTRAAILAFRADNGLPLGPDIDPAFVAALQTAKPREVSPERADGKPAGSRILKASNGQIASGLLGVTGVAASAIAPAVETAERAKDVTERSAALLNLTEWLSPLLPWAGVFIFLIVIALAFRARAARIEDYRSGKTP